jgi:hypothetical protein
MALWERSDLTGQPSWTSGIRLLDRTFQCVPTERREVPCPDPGQTIDGFPLGPTAGLAGALRGFPDSGGLGIVPGPEIPQRL